MAATLLPHSLTPPNSRSSRLGASLMHSAPPHIPRNLGAGTLAFPCLTSNFHPMTCQAMIHGDINGFHDYRSKALKVWEMTPLSIQRFPWMKTYNRLSQRVKGLLWLSMKWIAVPTLIISAVSEIMYAFKVDKAFLIPLGLLVGIMLANTLKETAMDLSKELQDGAFPWHLVVIGVFFFLTKLCGPYLPVWLAAFLPHLANGGLVQTLRFAVKWQKSVGERPVADSTKSIAPTK